MTVEAKPGPHGECSGVKMFARVSARQTAVTFIHTSVQHYVIHKQLLLQRDKNSTPTTAWRSGESEMSGGLSSYCSCYLWKPLAPRLSLNKQRVGKWVVDFEFPRRLEGILSHKGFPWGGCGRRKEKGERKVGFEDHWLCECVYQIYQLAGETLLLYLSVRKATMQSWRIVSHSWIS